MTSPSRLPVIKSRLAALAYRSPLILAGLSLCPLAVSADNLYFNPDAGMINGQISSIVIESSQFQWNGVTIISGLTNNGVQDYLVLGDFNLHAGQTLTANDGSKNAIRLIVYGNSTIADGSIINIAAAGAKARAGGGSGGTGGTGGAGGAAAVSQAFESTNESNLRKTIWRGANGNDAAAASAGGAGGAGVGNSVSPSAGGAAGQAGTGGLAGATPLARGIDGIGFIGSAGGSNGGFGGFGGTRGQDAPEPGQTGGATAGGNGSSGQAGSNGGYGRTGTFSLVGGNGGSGGGGNGGGGSGGSGGSGTGGGDGGDGQKGGSAVTSGGSGGAGGLGGWGTPGGRGGAGGTGSAGANGGAGGGALEISALGHIIVESSINASGARAATSQNTYIASGGGRFPTNRTGSGQNGGNGLGADSDGAAIGGAGGAGGKSSSPNGASGQSGGSTGGAFSVFFGGGGGGGGGYGAASGNAARGADGGTAAQGSGQIGGHGAGGTVILSASVVTGTGTVNVSGGGPTIGTSNPAASGGSLVIATNTSTSSAPALASGSTGSRSTAAGKSGVNPHFAWTPNTPLIAGNVLEGGLPHAFGVLEDRDIFLTPFGGPSYAIAVVRKFDESSPLGADYLGHEGLVFQNLTDRTLANPSLGQTTRSKLGRSNGLGTALDVFNRYIFGMEIGSQDLAGLDARADWVTLAPQGSQPITAEAAGLTGGGTLTSAGDAFYIISPRISAEAQGAPGFLLVGSSTRVEIDVTNLNLDQAADLTLKGVSGTTSASVDSSPVLMDVAEGEMKTLAVDVTAKSRGAAGEITLASNDFFEPEASVNVGTGVAPLGSVSHNNTATQLRAGQVLNTTVKIRNAGDGNLSGQGAISNLNGAFMGSGDDGISFGVADGSFSLEDGAELEVPISISSDVFGRQSFRVAVALKNGSGVGNSSGNRLARSEVEVRGPRPELSFTDAAGESVLTSPGIDFPITFSRNTSREIKLRIVNRQTIVSGITGLAVFGAEITGADAGLFSIAGFTPGTVTAGSFEELTIHFDGTGREFYDATLTFATDHLAPDGAETSGESFSFALGATPAFETVVTTASFSPDLTTKISVADLLASITGGEGLPLSLVSVGDPENAGSSVRISGRFIIYTPAPGQSGGDSFTYQLTDGFQTVTGTIQILPNELANAVTFNIVRLEIDGETATIVAAGIPGLSYRVDRSENLTDWEPLGQGMICPESGIMNFPDPGPLPASRFYRVVDANQ